MRTDLISISSASIFFHSSASVQKLLGLRPYGQYGRQPAWLRVKTPPIPRASAARANSCRLGALQGDSTSITARRTLPFRASLTYRGSLGGLRYSCLCFMRSSRTIPVFSLPGVFTPVGNAMRRDRAVVDSRCGLLSVRRPSNDDETGRTGLPRRGDESCEPRLAASNPRGEIVAA